MSPVRINVIGASGVGKTTLARAVAERLAIPHFDSDAYYHLPTDPPFQKQRTPEDRCTLVERELGPLDHWVLSGAVGTWTPTPALRYSLHAFLWLPSELRIERIVRREREQYGDRILPGGDMAEVHAEFIAWTRGYDDGTAEGTNTLPCHEELLRRATNPVLRLSGPIPVEEAVERVLGEIRR